MIIHQPSATSATAKLIDQQCLDEIYYDDDIMLIIPSSQVYKGGRTS